MQDRNFVVTRPIGPITVKNIREFVILYMDVIKKICNIMNIKVGTLYKLGFLNKIADHILVNLL